MATVINDLILEPKVSPPPAEASAASAASGGSPPAGPELERQLLQIDRRQRERGLRLWAH